MTIGEDIRVCEEEISREVANLKRQELHRRSREIKRMKRKTRNTKKICPCGEIGKYDHSFDTASGHHVALWYCDICHLADGTSYGRNGLRPHDITVLRLLLREELSRLTKPVASPSTAPPSPLPPS